jgi:hypothetical protein
MRHELIHIGSQILARWKSEIVKKQKKKTLLNWVNSQIPRLWT